MGYVVTVIRLWICQGGCPTLTRVVPCEVCGGASCAECGHCADSHLHAEPWVLAMHGASLTCRQVGRHTWPPVGECKAGDEHTCGRCNGHRRITADNVAVYAWRGTDG